MYYELLGTWVIKIYSYLLTYGYQKIKGLEIKTENICQLVSLVRLSQFRMNSFVESGYGFRSPASFVFRVD